MRGASLTLHWLGTQQAALWEAVVQLAAACRSRSAVCSNLFWGNLLDSQLRFASAASAGLRAASTQPAACALQCVGRSSLIGIPPKSLDSRRIGVRRALDVQNGTHVPMQLLCLVIVPLEQLRGLQT